MTRRMTTLLGTIQQLNESVQGLKPGDTTPIDVNPYGDDDVRKLLMNGCSELNDNKIEKNWASNLFKCFQKQLQESGQCGNVTVNIDIIIIVWLLIEFFEKKQRSGESMNQVAIETTKSLKSKKLEAEREDDLAEFFREKTSQEFINALNKKVSQIKAYVASNP